MIERIEFLRGAALTSTFGAFSGDSAQAFAQLERTSGGRLGVCAYDIAKANRKLLYRGDERFPMCSTFKVLLVAAVLQRVDAGKEHLERAMRFGKADVLEYAPVSKTHLAAGAMTVSTACSAAIELSDNTAANLLLASIGGPAAYTKFARGLGDAVTRLDRNEPALNTSVPGDARDTTSPRAMAASLARVAFGSELTPASRDRLRMWMRATKTGDARLRAGIHAPGRIGDKTGTGDNGSTNDIAFVLRPATTPLVIAAYYTGSTADSDARNRVLAQAGALVAKAFAT